MKLSDLPGMVKHSELMFFAPNDSLVVFYSRDDMEEHGMNTITRIFKVHEDKETVEEVKLENTIETLVKALADKIDIKDLLRHLLTKQSPPELIRAEEIVSKHSGGKPEVKAKPGCYALSITDPRPGKDAVNLYLLD
jgi:hypothetical protein